MDQLDTRFIGPHWTFPQSASGDLGALRLERSDFVQSLETLLEGDLWNGAAFVAERVLTLSELQTFVERNLPAPNASADDWKVKLRYLLGRRLVRDGQYKAAGEFIPAPWDEVLKKYVAALQVAHDRSRPKEERAHGFFTAAWFARYDGMELMGTEGAPDGFATAGEFPIPDLAQQMRTGFYKAATYDGTRLPVAKTPIILKVPSMERTRLTKSKPSPDLRFHYRVIAAALAIDAAKLLPNDSEELADVVNRAGLWVKDEDEKLGDRCYQLLQQRAAQTTIGRAAGGRHWFVDQAGAWTQAEKQAEEAMRRELKIPAEE